MKMQTRSAVDRPEVALAGAPKLGLRFDRARVELVLDAPLALERGVRLDAMRTELAPREGRLSLSEGWRAFRHRRSSLIEASVSVGLSELASLLGGAWGVPTSVVALSASTASIALTSEAMSLAVDVAWGFDGEDLLVVADAARSIPLGPRAPVAVFVDAAVAAGATLDVERGALRIPRPMRAVLMGALVAAGIRLPSTAGLAMRTTIEGDRLHLVAERATVAKPEASRVALERARAEATQLAACVEGEGPAPESGAPVARAAAALHALLAEGAPAGAEVERAATELASRERHPALASRALLMAAERASDRGWLLALAAIERGGLAPVELVRAVELAALGGTSSGTPPPWERLARTLEGVGPSAARARGLALERAERPADALALLADVVRAAPDDAIALGGMARALSALARHDESVSVWDRVASVSEGATRDEARLAAADALRAAGHTEAAITRLRALVVQTPPSDATLAAHQRLASALLQHVGLEAAIEVDRSLARLTDALGGLHAVRAASALRRAIDRAIGGHELALARAHLAALDRLLGEAGREEQARWVRSIAEAEERALSAGDPPTLRARAESLRAEGRTADAARVLVELFAQTQDAAVLRAAIELADRSADVDARRAVFDRALAVLPPGPARDAILARR